MLKSRTTIKRVNSPGAPAAIGPYNHASIFGGNVYVSGQLGMLPATGELTAGGITEQTVQALANLDAILESCDSSRSRVLKTTILLSDMADFPVVNELYENFFGGEFPARETYAVKALPKGGLIEISCIATQSPDVQLRDMQDALSGIAPGMDQFMDQFVKDHK